MVCDVLPAIVSFYVRGTLTGRWLGPGRHCIRRPCAQFSGGSRRQSDRGSTLQFWALWVWRTWLAWKLDLCDDVVKQNLMVSIFRKLGSLKSDWGSSPLRPPRDSPLQLPVEVHHKTKILRRFQIRSSHYFLRSCNYGTAQNFTKSYYFTSCRVILRSWYFHPCAFFFHVSQGIL